MCVWIISQSVLLMPDPRPAAFQHSRGGTWGINSIAQHMESMSLLLYVSSEDASQPLGQQNQGEAS